MIILKRQSAQEICHLSSHPWAYYTYISWDKLHNDDINNNNNNTSTTNNNNNNNIDNNNNNIINNNNNCLQISLIIS